MTSPRLRLEFAPNARRTSRSSLAFLLTGLLLFAVATLFFGRALLENAHLNRNLAAIEGRRNAVMSKPNPRPDATELARVQFIRQTSRSLTTPWADLLAALEAAPTNVALLSVDPSTAKRTISLTAEAANPEDMLNYLRALQQDSRFTEALLTSHQVEVQAPGTPVRFQLQVNWGGKP